MLFHSLEYILFLLLAVACYWALRRYAFLRLLYLFIASCRFYMAWNVKYIGLILFTILADYTFGLLIGRSNKERTRKVFVIASVLCNLGLLATFKYFNFFATAVRDTLLLIGLDCPLPYLNVILPVGISFYTFQSMSYTIDVYRRVIEPERNLLRYACFLTFFPQLVAGPIVRAKDLLPQLKSPPFISSKMASEGLYLILRGLIKKVAVADYLGVNLVDRVFDNPEAYTSVEVLIALYAYSMQIYCDFSGYTDVARGSGLLMGFRLPENFDRPYQAASPAEFWRRWHMTLSSWLRDYVYFPLGGSRRSPARTYFNLWITLFLIGLWHGAGWTFVIYGAIHGSAMVLHRYFYKRSGRTKDTKDPLWLHILKVFATFHFCVFSRILFRSPDLETAYRVALQLFHGTLSVAQVTSGLWAAIVIPYLIHWTPKRFFVPVEHLFIRLPAPLQGAVAALVGAFLTSVASSEVVPYIYFQF